MFTIETARASSVGTDIVNKANSYSGVPYRFGGISTSGFDCSGFVRHVFRDFGVELPRTASQQQRVGTPVSKSNLKPGDIVFFANTYQSGISHNGIYIGNNKFIGSQSSTGVAVTSLNSSYWGPRYHSAKRVIEEPKKETVVSKPVTKPEPIIYEELPIGQYHDVPNKHWAHGSIKELSKQNIINGYGNSFFKPEESITRAQAAMILNRHFKFSASGTKNYPDVTSNTMGYNDIRAISATGLMEGYEDGSFRPEKAVSRQEVAAILDRAFEWENEPVSLSSIDNQFSDIFKDDWSYEYVVKLSEIGIITGFEDRTFRPEEQTTRAQFTSLIDRAIN